MSFFITTIFFTGAVFGQQDKKTTDQGKQETEKTEDKATTSGENKPVGTYLDVSHARENAIEYDETIRDHIYKLQVVVANFGEAGDKSALESIVKEHVQGKKELFKRKYLSAAIILKKVRKDIQNLFLNLTTRYQTKNDI
jgi:hypothetical protein